MKVKMKHLEKFVRLCIYNRISNSNKTIKHTRSDSLLKDNRKEIKHKKHIELSKKNILNILNF